MVRRLRIAETGETHVGVAEDTSRGRDHQIIDQNRGVDRTITMTRDATEIGKETTTTRIIVIETASKVATTITEIETAVIMVTQEDTTRRTRVTGAIDTIDLPIITRGMMIGISADQVTFSSSAAGTIGTIGMNLIDHHLRLGGQRRIQYLIKKCQR